MRLDNPGKRDVYGIQGWYVKQGSSAQGWLCIFGRVGKTEFFTKNINTQNVFFQWGEKAQWDGRTTTPVIIVTSTECVVFSNLLIFKHNYEHIGHVSE